MKMNIVKKMFCVLVCATSVSLHASQSLVSLSQKLSAFEQNHTLGQQTNMSSFWKNSIFTKLSSSVHSISHWSTQDKILGAVGVAAGLYIGALCTVLVLKRFGFQYHGITSIWPWWPCAYEPKIPEYIFVPESKNKIKTETRIVETVVEKKEEVSQPEKIIKLTAPVFTKPPLLEYGGNTCYIDSVVTSLIMNKNFCEAICALEEKSFDVALVNGYIEKTLSDSKKDTITEEEKKRFLAQANDLIKTKIGICFLKELRLLIQSLSDGDCVDSVRLKKLHTAARAWFGGSTKQQESFDLLSKILDVCEYLGITLHLTKIQKGMSCVYDECEYYEENKKICSRCVKWNDNGISSVVEISLSSINLRKQQEKQIKERKSSLGDVLLRGEYQDMNGEEVTHCDHCKNITNRASVMRFVPTLPKTLICHINRGYSKDGVAQKLFDQILLPEKLNLADLDGRCTDELKKSNKTNYLLSSVVCHSGSGLNSGHYVTYVKCKNDWYLMNDLSSEAKRLNEKEKKDLFDGNPSEGNPVLVFYDQQP